MTSQAHTSVMPATTLGQALCPLRSLSQVCCLHFLLVCESIWLNCFCACGYACTFFLSFALNLLSTASETSPNMHDHANYLSINNVDIHWLKCGCSLSLPLFFSSALRCFALINMLAGAALCMWLQVICLWLLNEPLSMRISWVIFFSLHAVPVSIRCGL